MHPAMCTATEVVVNLRVRGEWVWSSSVGMRYSGTDNPQVGNYPRLREEIVTDIGK